MDKLQTYLHKCAVPVTKSKRELLGDIYMSCLGIVTGVLAIKSGGWMVIVGIMMLAMPLILLFTPEN